MELTHSSAGNNSAAQPPKNNQQIKPKGSVKPARKRNLKRRFIIAIILALLLAVSFLGWQYVENQKELVRLRDPQVVAAESTAKLLADVGELIVLPENETPTIATVISADELKDQPFFATAENGDQVLIYSQARQAILYRPSTHKIIRVAPVDLGSEEDQQNNQ